eukprot:SAG31_NODE_120_length_23892_cov_10.545623_24_plen_412_part_00
MVLPCSSSDDGIGSGTGQHGSCIGVAWAPWALYSRHLFNCFLYFSEPPSQRLVKALPLPDWSLYGHPAETWDALNPPGEGDIPAVVSTSDDASAEHVCFAVVLGSINSSVLPASPTPPVTLHDQMACGNRPMISQLGDLEPEHSAFVLGFTLLAASALPGLVARHRQLADRISRRYQCSGLQVDGPMWRFGATLHFGNDLAAGAAFLALLSLLLMAWLPLSAAGMTVGIIHVRTPPIVVHAATNLRSGRIEGLHFLMICAFHAHQVTGALGTFLMITFYEGFQAWLCLQLQRHVETPNATAQLERAATRWYIALSILQPVVVTGWMLGSAPLQYIAAGLPFAYFVAFALDFCNLEQLIMVSESFNATNAHGELLLSDGAVERISTIDAQPNPLAQPQEIVAVSLVAVSTVA